jgi:TorA maturation chaperone TorD
MYPSATLTESTAIDLARECLYRFLAATLGDPHSEGFRVVFDEASLRVTAEAADLLRGEVGTEPVRLGFGELPADQLTFRQLEAELRAPFDNIAADHERLWGMVQSRECPPYETEYHDGNEPFFRAQQLADIAGFYRAFGLEPSATIPERVDHIAFELEFMAFLLMKKRLAGADTEQALVCDEAQGNFFRDHLAWWVPAFLMGIRRKVHGGFYQTVAQILSAFLPLERQRFEVPAPRLPLIPAASEEEHNTSTECAACTS